MVCVCSMMSGSQLEDQQLRVTPHLEPGIIWSVFTHVPGGWGLGPQVGLSFWSTSVLLGVIPCGLGFLRHGGLSLSHFIRGRSGPQVWLFHWKRWKVHCFLWPSLGGHVMSPLLYSGLKHLQAPPFSRGGESDYLWVEEWKATLQKRVWEERLLAPCW